MYYSVVKSFVLKLVTISFMVILFLSVFLPTYEVQMPQHVDSWIVISIADRIVKDHYIPRVDPFRGATLEYPKGVYAFVAVIHLITGIDMITLSQLLPAIIFVVMGALNYAIALRLFNKRTVAILSVVFTLLVLTNMTMLGPFYLVPLTFGALLILLMLYFISSGKIFLAILTYFAIPLTHMNSAMFATLILGLFFIVNNPLRYWKYLVLFLVIGITGFLLFLTTKDIILSPEGLLDTLRWGFFVYFKDFFKLPIERPFINYLWEIKSIFFFFFGSGLFFILLREKKARKILVPSFIFLAINLYLFWNYKTGYFLFYRRTIFYLFLLSPLFISYGVFAIADVVSSSLLLFTKNRLTLLIRHTHLFLVVLLIILIPEAVSINLNAHPSHTWVSKEEHLFFKDFGKQHPNSYILTDHLEAYALPYYDLKPIMTSPMHQGGNFNFDQFFYPYLLGNGEVIASFFVKNDLYNYVYYPREMQLQNFTAVASQYGLWIYQYQREKNDHNNSEVDEVSN
ncbi:hypothetical protein HY605_04550 [Candidatus Peregrinibacteria bacterium]|nr:hypothetical protein [Candidatus Peregrinibacteria bacterium]